MNDTTPNAIIFRLPDVDGSKTFLQIPLNGTSLDFAECYEFNVLDGDDYNLLGFDQIVLAILSDDGDSSIELARVDITAVDGSPVVIHANPVELITLVHQLVDEWNNLD